MTYERHRRECGRKSLFLRRSKFINYAFVRANKRILGRSIDERSPRIDTRKDFGHWECDLVLGHKSKDDVLLTLYERKTHRFFMIKIEDKTSVSIMKAFNKLREFYGSKWNRIFKSITTDNGSKFANLSKVPSSRIYQILSKFPRRLCTMLPLIHPVIKVA
jgi:IS30 family transposase